jgi:hypothetical protein
VGVPLRFNTVHSVPPSLRDFISYNPDPYIDDSVSRLWIRIFRSVSFRALVKQPLRIQREASSFVTKAFWFPLYSSPVLHVMYNIASRPTCGTISPESHEQGTSLKYSSLYTTLHISTSQYYQYSQNRHDTLKQKPTRSLACDFLSNLRTMQSVQVDSPLL